MKKNFQTLAIVALGAVLAGCAAPKTGRDDATYYYSNKAVTAVPKVEPAPPAPVQNGPAGVPKIVYFDFDKYNIRPQDRQIVEAHASYMRNRAASRVVIEGNTDQRGGREYNLALGQRRAESVKKVMTVLGVPESRIETVSYGEEKPKSSGHDEGAWAQNRRADIVYKGL
jgi:peptidoglycan-associated lipoprotein